jgi:hypothetical protein
MPLGRGWAVGFGKHMQFGLFADSEPDRIQTFLITPRLPVTAPTLALQSTICVRLTVGRSDGNEAMWALDGLQPVQLAGTDSDG